MHQTYRLTRSGVLVELDADGNPTDVMTPADYDHEHPPIHPTRSHGETP